MSSFCDRLAELLRESGARATLDFERSTARPCVGCGAPPPHRLAVVGTYVRDLPGNLRAGDAIERPLCGTCRALFSKESP